MLSIQYQNRIFHLTEHIGKEEPKGEKHIKTDVLIKFELSFAKPDGLVQKKGVHSFELNIPNYLIDLSQDEEQIFGKIHKSTRAEIRKAKEKHGLSFVEIEHPSDEQIIEFATLYNEFSKEKGINFCNVEKLKSIRNNHALVMAYVKDKQSNILGGYTVFIDQECSQLYGIYIFSRRFTNSIPVDKRVISRANKYLQWEAIRSAKRRGLAWFNFGAEVIQKKDVGVNKFKKYFGTIQGYDRRIYIPKSLLGGVFVFILYLKWKWNLRNHQAFKVSYSAKAESTGDLR